MPVVTIITVKGDVFGVEPSVKAIKNALKAAKIVPMWLLDGSCLLVDEEGFTKRLATNNKATHLAERPMFYPIVGKVAHIPKKLVKTVLG